MQYAIVCEARANTDFNKMDFIHAVAKMVPEPHTVDLKKPDKTILVQIVKVILTLAIPSSNDVLLDVLSYSDIT